MLSKREREELRQACSAEHPYQHRSPEIISRRHPRESGHDQLGVGLALRREGLEWSRN